MAGEQSSTQEIFQHPDAQKINLICDFYKNDSGFDLVHIVDQITKVHETVLEVKPDDSIVKSLPSIQKCNRKFIVVLIGE
jgi:hypothetical protein